MATTFGSAAFFRDTDYKLEHSRNILKEIWDGPSESTIFPPSVWSFLTSPGPDQQTPREILIQKWRSKAGISKNGSEEEETRASLVFGEGGVYELSDLRARGAMLDLLASTIELMNQDIEILMREILQRQNNESPDPV